MSMQVGFENIPRKQYHILTMSMQVDFENIVSNLVSFVGSLKHRIDFKI